MILCFIGSALHMTRFSHIYTWFVLPSSCYGFASCFYIRYVIQDSYVTRRDFFVFYIIFIACIVRIYEYILFKSKPHHISDICDLTDDPENCEDAIDRYFIFGWWFSLLINFYFAYVLMEFKEDIDKDYDLEERNPY